MKYLIILLLLSVQGFGQVSRTDTVKYFPGFLVGAGWGDNGEYQGCDSTAIRRALDWGKEYQPRPRAAQIGKGGVIIDARRIAKEAAIRTDEKLKYRLDSLIAATMDCTGEIIIQDEKITAWDTICALRHPSLTEIKEYLTELTHPHKWVELHQDTVEDKTVIAWNRGQNIYTPYFSKETAVGEYHTTNIALICLICHEEKRKIIHYKR